MVRHTVEDFIDEEHIVVSTMTSFKSSSIYSTKLDAPQANRFPGDDNASLSKKIFYISVAEIETIVEPDSVGDDLWRESVALIRIHLPILPISACLLGNTLPN